MTGAPSGQCLSPIKLVVWREATQVKRLEKQQGATCTVVHTKVLSRTGVFSDKGHPSAHVTVRSPPWDLLRGISTCSKGWPSDSVKLFLKQCPMVPKSLEGNWSMTQSPGASMPGTGSHTSTQPAGSALPGQCVPVHTPLPHPASPAIGLCVCFYRSRVLALQLSIPSSRPEAMGRCPHLGLHTPSMPFSHTCCGSELTPNPNVRQTENRQFA